MSKIYCKLKNELNIYTGNSISDSEKDNYLEENDAYPYISTKDIDINTNKIDYYNDMYIKKDDKKFKVAPIGSTLLCIEGGSAGKKIAYTEENVCFVNKLCCLNSKTKYNRYYYWFLQSDNFKSEFNLNLSGMIGGVSQSQLKNIRLITYNIEKQKKISNYLDNKCSIIDSAIEKNKNSIEQMQEYKNTLITKCVSIGINKKKIIKKSENTLISEIPENWNIVRVKNTSWLKGRIGWQGLNSNEYLDEGAFLITGTDFNNGRINWETCVHISEERFKEAPDIHIQENDLLITKDGTIGKIALAKNCPDEVSLNSGVLLIRNTKKIKYLGKFLYYVLSSYIFWKWYRYNEPGNATIKHLYQEKFYNFQYGLPPNNEQQEIVEYLDNKCSQIDIAILKRKELIEKLKEYKKSLIYEAITGKIEV